jgi:hypothetical protein
MTTEEVARDLVGRCRQGDFAGALANLYSPDIVSIEACAGPDGSRQLQGIDAIKAKNEWWVANHDVHAFEVTGPFLAPEGFAVKFWMDVTPKGGQRTEMEEMALYTVKDGKVVQEEFFYHMPGQ